VTVGSLLLPDDAVLLHVGMFKTGTTAIQGALFRARPQLAEHGVLHAGETRNPMQAVLAFRGQQMKGKPPPRIERWDSLVAQVAAASDQRVVVSSEFLGTADVKTARRAVEAMGGPRVHVVVTLRPLAKILPSQWQQYVRGRATTTSYDDWLDGMLRKSADGSLTPAFRNRNHHEGVVGRWASIVGPENLTVIIVDETDRNFLLRTFEELLGLPTGLLVLERDTENRSLTLGETELVRQINVEFLRRGWSDELYRRMVLKGVGFQMQTNRTPKADEPRITTPQWALDRVAEIGAAAAEKISTLGVRVVGDISTLGAPRISDASPEARDPATLPVDAAREAVIGAILASGVLTVMPVETTPARDLLRVIGSRQWRRLRGQVGKPDLPEPGGDGEDPGPSQ
jgi:hypothetical protein